MTEDREKDIRQTWEHYNSDYYKRSWLKEFFGSNQFRDSKRVRLPAVRSIVVSYKPDYSTPTLLKDNSFEYELKCTRYTDGSKVYEWVCDQIVLETNRVLPEFRKINECL